MKRKIKMTQNIRQHWHLKVRTHFPKPWIWKSDSTNETYGAYDTLVKYLAKSLNFSYELQPYLKNMSDQYAHFAHNVRTDNHCNLHQNPNTYPKLFFLIRAFIAHRYTCSSMYVWCT